MTRKQVFWSVGAPLTSFALYTAMIVTVPETWRLWIISELGPVELGTAALFLAAAAVAMVLAWRFASIPARYRALFCLFALGGVFVALEELSYGQHVAGWSSPEWVAERNAREETNLHNLYDNFLSRRMRTAANLAFPLVAIALPLYLRRRGNAYRPGSAVWFLLPKMELACLAVVATACTAPQKVFQHLNPHGDNHWMGLGELKELYWAIGALGIMLLVYCRQLTTATATESASTPTAGTTPAPERAANHRRRAA